MGILSGIVSYAFGLALNLLDAAVNGFLSALGFDLDAFEQFFPAAADFYDVIIGFSIGLLFMMLLFQLFRNFGIVLDMEAEDPLKILGKTALFLGMIIYSRSIVNLILKLMADPYSIFLNAASAPYKFELITLATAMFGSSFSNPFFSIVALIMMLVLGWQFLKLTVECVERYIVFYFVLYCAPVVFSTGAFKSTAQIFKSWCRMVGSQALLLLINIWSIKLFLSFVPVFESGSGDMIFNFIMGYAFLKFAQKADTLLRILGLNTASTGDMMGSLAGSIAGIAMTIRSVGNAARGVVSAVGGRMGNPSGGGNSSSNNSGDPGEDNGISGMRTPKRPSPGGGTNSEEPVGITASGISAAKQGYITDVLRAARMQEAAASPDGSPEDRVEGETADGSKEDAPGKENIPLETAKQAERLPNLSAIDSETTEGLSNLAHGIPHDHYDPETRHFSGGGFPEFVGKDANLIGAMQLSPADGYSRSSVKLADGSVGTVYRNEETGDAQIVQFASVDNGVMQGTIRQIDAETGQLGEDFAFEAVHSSVPGAETFSSHSVPVQEPSGGTYYVATGADTSFLSQTPMESPQSAGTSYTPGGTSRMQRAGGIRTETGQSYEGPGVSPLAQDASITEPDTAPSPVVVGNMMEQVSATGEGRRTISGAQHPAPEYQQSFPSETTLLSGVPLSAGSFTPASPGTVGVQPMDQPINDEMTRSSSAGGVFSPAQANGDSPSVSGMNIPQNQVRRFSKNNPANLEVFRREKSQVEAFDKPPSETPPVSLPKKQKKKG